jgi:predicted transcriptional regulator
MQPFLYFKDLNKLYSNTVLAKKLGISRSCVYKYSCGHLVQNAETFKAIVKFHASHNGNFDGTKIRMFEINRKKGHGAACHMAPIANLP